MREDSGGVRSVIENQHGLGARQLDFLDAILAVDYGVAHAGGGVLRVSLLHRDRRLYRYLSEPWDGLAPSFPQGAHRRDNARGG